MSSFDLAGALAEQRLGLADTLDSLTPEQLATASWCSGWSVKDVAAHLTTLFNVSNTAILKHLAGNRFRFHAAVRQVNVELAARPIGEITAQLRANADNLKHPPTMPRSPLADVIIHAEDIRRPLGLPTQAPFDSVAAAMTFIVSGRASFFTSRRTIHGLMFQATDGDGSWGRGQLIHGPAIDLMLAVTGRRGALANLGGAAKVLDERLTGKVPRIQ